MMSEKRFTFDVEQEFEIFDKETGEHYDGTVGDQRVLCKIMNEQQATIDRLKNAIRIAYEEKPYPTLEDIKDKFKELQE